MARVKKINPKEVEREREESSSSRSTEGNGVTSAFSPTSPRSSISSPGSTGKGKKVAFEDDVDELTNDDAPIVVVPLAPVRTRSTGYATRSKGTKRPAEEAVEPTIPTPKPKKAKTIAPKTTPEKPATKKKSPPAKKRKRSDTTYAPHSDIEDLSFPKRKSPTAKKGEKDGRYRPSLISTVDTSDDEGLTPFRPPKAKGKKKSTRPNFKRKTTSTTNKTRVAQPTILPPPDSDSLAQIAGVPATLSSSEYIKRMEGNEETKKDEEEFWPGDAVFLFGETKFLEEVKSREIERDLSGGMSFPPSLSPFPLSF